MPAPASTSSLAPSFGERLTAVVAARETNVVVGLDPDPLALWPTGDAPPGPAAVRTAGAVLAHCRAVLDAVAPAVVAAKLQLACFERLGAPGWTALEAVAEHARGLGLLVLADAKRGDVDVSALAYAQALLGATATPFGEVEGLGADAMTASAYMGADTLDPLLATGRRRGRGVFVLVRTSNPGARDVEDLETAGGEPVWAQVARIVDRLGSEAGGDETALTDVGAVVGATAPEHLERLRELMPRTPFLLPGVGAQGGRVADLAAAWLPGRAGGLVTASRSLVGAPGPDGAPGSAGARAEAERLRAEAWSAS